MTAPRKKILLIIHMNTYFTGLLPVARALAKRAEFIPVFLFAAKYPTLRDDMETCRKENIEALLGGWVKIPSRAQAMGSEQAGQVKKPAKRQKSLRAFAGSIFFRLFAGTILDVAWRLSRQMIQVRKILRQEKISLVVLPADNRYDQAAYVKAAHLEHTGVALVPQFMAGLLEWAEYVWDQPAYQMSGYQNRLASFFYPRWMCEYKGRKLLALPGSEVFIREWLGIAPPLPWILHSGSADVLALESEAVRDYCLAEGLPSSKMVITGSIAHDTMYEVLSHLREKRDELCTALGLDASRPLILSALPPDNLYMGRPECDFQNFADLVKFWCQSISSIYGYNHVVVLHPSHNYENIKYIEDYGLKIARMPTPHAIPLCDIYVAPGSSTIQWAIACGKPVVNYDVFRYRYTDYQNVSGVVTVEEQEELLATLKKLTTNQDYYALIAARQKDCAEHWGRLDGEAAARLQDVFHSAITSYTQERSAR